MMIPYDIGSLLRENPWEQLRRNTAIGLPEVLLGGGHGAGSDEPVAHDAVGAGAPDYVSPFSGLEGAVDQAARQRAESRGRLLSLYERPSLPVPEEVRPALRTSDLLGAAPGIILSLLGRGRDATDYLQGLLNGKISKAQMHTRARMLGYQNQVADQERQAERAKIDLGFADQDYQNAVQRYAAGVQRQQAQAKLEREQRDQALDNLLKQLQVEKAGKELGSWDADHQRKVDFENLRNDRMKEALNFMPEKHRREQMSLQSQIAARRANMAMMGQNLDRQWFESFQKVYDRALQDVNEQLKSWVDLSKKRPLTDEEGKIVDSLSQYSKDLATQRDAIPIPARAEVELPPISNEQLGLAPTNVLGGGLLGVAGAGPRINTPKGGYAPPITQKDAAAKAKADAIKKAAERKEKEWEDYRKNAIEAKRDVVNGSGTQKTVDYWLDRMDMLKPGSSGRSKTGPKAYRKRVEEFVGEEDLPRSGDAAGRAKAAAMKGKKSEYELAVSKVQQRLNKGEITQAQANALWKQIKAAAGK